MQNPQIAHISIVCEAYFQPYILIKQWHFATVFRSTHILGKMDYQKQSRCQHPLGK